MRIRARARFAAATAILALGLASGLPAMAGQLPAELRKLGLTQVFGDGAVQDVTAGIANLESAATAGDITAKAELGKILLDGHYVAADAARGIQLLEQAAEAGHAGADLTLGKAYLWGNHVARDAVRARTFLEKSATLGKTEAMRILGEQLVWGTAWPTDARAGKAYLEKAIAGGDVKAGITLGSILLNGAGRPRDAARALQLFEAAAKSGDGQGLEIYGEWLMWRLSDPAAAEAMLRRAAGLGRGTAWSILAEGAMYGYLEPDSRAKFPAFAEKARAAGDMRIAVLEAQRQMWGISMRASGPATIALLENDSRKGNPEAARFLIGLVRDGNHLNIRQDTARALAYVEDFSAVLTPRQSQQLRFSIRAKSTRSVTGYRKLEAELEQQRDLIDSGFIRELVKSNLNFAVYLLQVRLMQKGVYAGPASGFATPRTIAALQTQCASLTPAVSCRRGVLEPAVVAAILLP